MQAAQHSKQQKLEATLINNLGTVLRNKHKYKRAVALHRQQLHNVEEQQGLHSAFLILARHNLVDIFNVLKRHDEARELLLSQISKLEVHVEEVRGQKAAGVTAEVVVGASEADGGGEGETKDALDTALQSLARCHMDYSKFLEGRGESEDALTQARKALALDSEASGQVRTALTGAAC
jgi:tetratricopeptide (TPR) repeat protein